MVYALCAGVVVEERMTVMVSFLLTLEELQTLAMAVWLLAAVASVVKRLLMDYLVVMSILKDLHSVTAIGLVWGSAVD